MAWFKKALIAAFTLTMIGCDPQFNISGAYFPDWLACILGALFCTWLLRLALIRIHGIQYLFPEFVIYLCIFIAFACSLWLLFFSA